jgi:hypothetical protein
VLLLSAAVPGQAFVRHTLQRDQTVYYPSWYPRLVPVQFSVNDRKLELLLNFAPGSELLPPVERALRTWAVTPNISAAVRGTVAATDLGGDRTNLITFADTPRNRDVTSNVTAMTLTWMVLEGNRAFIAESDIAINPKERVATDGREDAADLQNVLVHEAGHAFGLSHSGIASATMFPYTRYGETTKRALDTDDVAGIKAIYEPSPELTTGTISGSVVTAAGAPVFGAHVVATGANGVVQVGVVTERDGLFRLPSLPPGEYEVYAEPLDDPVVPGNLGGYWAGSPSPLVAFRTTYAGGNGTPARVTVARRRTAALDPIRVEAQKGTINPRWVSWSPDGRFREFWATAVPLAPGAKGVLAVGGEGLGTLPASAFRFSGEEITLDASGVGRSTLSNGVPMVFLPLSVRADARPGGRTLLVTTDAERAAYTGVVRITAPQ